MLILMCCSKKCVYGPEELPELSVENVGLFVSSQSQTCFFQNETAW